MYDDIIIWGAGKWGNLAYHYYKERCNIICYIDSNQQKWGTMMNGLPICSPDILHTQKAAVVMAIKRDINIIKEELYKKYGIEKYVLFSIMTQNHSAVINNEDDINDVEKDSVVVLFQGGLGNQMFLYAFLKNMEVNGLTVLADLEFYKNIGIMEFQLTTVFRHIQLETCTKEQEQRIIEKNMEDHNGGQFLIYSERNIYSEMVRKADLSILNITGGIIYGFHQTHIYADRIREILLKDFEFDIESGSDLEKIYNEIAQKNAVSIHIRRGDYLSEESQKIYGNICTQEYYDKAMEYIEKQVGEYEFIFFSNDIAWVKKNYCMKNAIYIEKQMFDHYCDWYDMCLMSICKHNIIANSTFSWWGAWLNQNSEKIVIAPKRWINLCEYEDIYPKDWITL